MATSPTTPTGDMPLRTPLIDNSSRMSYPWIKWFQQLLQSKFPTIPAFFAAPHSTKASVRATSYADGSIFFETDRQVAYIAVAGVWTYLTGVYPATQAQIPTDLGTADAGFEFNVTDYQHKLFWDGAQWNFAGGDAGSGYVAAFVNVPLVGWAPCNGQKALALQSNGNAIAMTTPNIPGSYFRR
jgi:hypothetical protein